MGSKWQRKTLSKEAQELAATIAKQASAEETKRKTLRDSQDEEAAVRQEKTDRLKALRLARDAEEE